LLFGHKELITVPGLGGECYKFSDTPEKKPMKRKEDEEEFGKPDCV